MTVDLDIWHLDHLAVRRSRSEVKDHGHKKQNKQFSYHRGTVQCYMLVKILSYAA